MFSISGMVITPIFAIETKPHIIATHRKHNQQRS